MIQIIVHDAKYSLTEVVGGIKRHQLLVYLLYLIDLLLILKLFKQNIYTASVKLIILKHYWRLKLQYGPENKYLTLCIPFVTRNHDNTNEQNVIIL